MVDGRVNFSSFLNNYDKTFNCLEDEYIIQLLFVSGFFI